jgi:hypothetical protein
MHRLRLIRKIKIDPKEYPIVQWRWKVSNLLQKGDVTRKEGDDYPARIYIAFEYDPKKLEFFEKTKYQAARLLYGEYPPLGAINYIWESRAPKGTVVPNPFTDRVKMIVVESGGSMLNQWVSEERNIFEDYKKAFGDEPPAISGVAIMTDADNTGESAIAYYGDIVFKKKTHLENGEGLHPLHNPSIPLTDASGFFDIFKIELDQRRHLRRLPIGLLRLLRAR